MRLPATLAAVVAVISAGAGCECARRPAIRAQALAGAPRPVPPPTVIAPGQPFVVAAAGDIAGRWNRHAETAALLLARHAKRPYAALLALGDLQYPRGDYHDFLGYYDPTWGAPALKSVTRPVPGNHEYAQGLSDADGYFDYFDGPGEPAGITGGRGRGYYSYDIGDWHFIALNTSDGCRKISCAPGGPMHAWLLADLAAARNKCVLAYWHHPRFQLGVYHKDNPFLAPLWDALYDAGADLVLAGHDHNFQQLAPLDKAGAPAPGRGIRSFVVGTGGAATYTELDERLHPGVLEARYADRVGILELALEASGYRWRFVAVDGTPEGQVLAEGRDGCH